MRAIGAKGPPHALLDALLSDLESRPPAPSVQSARNYRLVYEVTSSILIKLASGLDIEARERLQDQVQQRLDLAPALHIKRSEKSAGAQKNKDRPSTKASKLTVDVIRRVLGDLKLHAETYGHYASAWVVFYICSASRIGWRPCEVEGAYFEEDTLFINTAKLRKGNAQVRRFPLTKIPENSRFAAEVICEHLPKMAWLRFQRWRNRLAEALSQSCDRLGIDRISLYACRHIAIQTWRTAGMSTAQIAELAGHMNVMTAQRHYGGRASPDWLQNTPLDPLVAATHSRPAETAPTTGTLDQVSEVVAPERSREVYTGEPDHTQMDVVASTEPQSREQAETAPRSGLDDLPLHAEVRANDRLGADYWNAYKRRLDAGERSTDVLLVANREETFGVATAPRFDLDDMPEPARKSKPGPDGTALWKDLRTRLETDGNSTPTLGDRTDDPVKPGPKR